MCVRAAGNENSHAFDIFVLVCNPWEEFVGADGALSDAGFCASCASPFNHMILILGEASWHGAQLSTATQTLSHAVLHTQSFLT